MNKIAFKSVLIFCHAIVLTLLATMTVGKSPSSLGYFAQETAADSPTNIFTSHLF